MKIVSMIDCLMILTGPQRVGKGSLVTILETWHGYKSFGINTEIKVLAHKLADQKWHEDLKDTPQERFGGMTPRDWYIAVGRLDVVLPDLFVKAMVDHQIRPIFDNNGPIQFAVVDNVRCQQQVAEVLRHTQPKKYLLVKMAGTDSDGMPMVFKDGREPVVDCFASPVVHNSYLDPFWENHLANEADHLVTLMRLFPGRDLPWEFDENWVPRLPKRTFSMINTPRGVFSLVPGAPAE